ncbi:MAG: hypothetical protein AAB654_15500 [Acidobacteriota bacterium]
MKCLDEDFDLSEQSAKNNNRASGSQDAEAKKPYRKPVLIKMGALRDVTMFKGYGKIRDGSKSKWNNRTGRGGL